MDNFTVPTETPPNETPAVPAGPSVASLPEPDGLEGFDNPPPPRPDVEDISDRPDQDSYATASTEQDGKETWLDHAKATVCAHPLLSIAVAGATGFVLALAIDGAIRLQLAPGSTGGRHYNT